MEHTALFRAMRANYGTQIVMGGLVPRTRVFDKEAVFFRLTRF